MNAKELRESLSNESQKLLGTWTRIDLYQALMRARSEEAGLSLLEISGIIKEVLGEDAAILGDDLVID